MTTKQDIEKVLWSACDSFRGKIDSSRYKDYILSMLLYPLFTLFSPICCISVIRSMYFCTSLRMEA